jgi:cytosine/adenosine deaminase-related metal-dependent hydrolase
MKLGALVWTHLRSYLHVIIDSLPFLHIHCLLPMKDPHRLTSTPLNMQSELLKKITCVRLPGKQPLELWDITIKEGRVASIEPHKQAADESNQDGTLDGHNRLIAPSLCHAHIHLDKCFLLQDPKYEDLQIESGDFKEAMEMTSTAKARFGEEDLMRRGGQLIEESIHHGVTAMRAFVEVDGVVQLKCLDAGLKLKQKYKDRCDIQICAFAQLPLFSGDDDGREVRKLMESAASNKDVEVLGSTPYVEDDENKAKNNVSYISALALASRKYLDLHLDYWLEEEKQPLMWDVLKIIKDHQWTENGGKQITLGHCTRLTRFKEKEWAQLKQEIGDFAISFVGLPTSDLFMMRTPENVRGTLPILELIKRYGFNAAVAINNVGNAFTPQGNCDPLSIAQLGVGLYQAPTKDDVQLLYVGSRFVFVLHRCLANTTMQEVVSSRAKAAIGREYNSLDLEPGAPADFILFDSMDSGWRCRKSIAEVVYDAGSTRQTVYQGRIATVNF